MARVVPNVVGFDDAPFRWMDGRAAHEPDQLPTKRAKRPAAKEEWRGDVRLVGAVCSRTRLDGVLSGRVRRDGANSTDRMIELVEGTHFAEHIRAVLLQGIAVAGFNVVDVRRLHETLDRPVLVVTRRLPDLDGMRRALFSRTRGAERKWRLIEHAGALEKCGPVYVQRHGLSLDEARELLRATTLHGNLPEPLRLAHLIAGGVTTGESRGRA